MSFIDQYKSGNLVLPTALFFHMKDIFASSDDFLVWQFIYLQNTTSLDEIAPSQIADAMGKSLTEINRLISSLEKQDLLSIKTIELAGDAEVIFDASPALAKLDKITSGSSLFIAPVAVTEKGGEIKSLISDIEQAMGLLNPMVLEDVQKLVSEDHVSPDLIREAVREAVFNNKINWKYIQGILGHWRREGVRTLEQVKERRLERERLNPANVTVSDDLLSAMKMYE